MDGYWKYFTGHQKSSIFHPDNVSPFQLLLEELLTLEETRSSNRELLENELLHRLATQLLLWQKEKDTDGHTDSTLSKLQEIRSYLDEHYTEKLSLDELAKFRFYISKYHMSRDLKKALASPWETT